MLTRSLPWWCLLVLACGCWPATPPDAVEFGRFEGDVVAAWDADGRHMTLRENFVYIDPQDRRWLAPAGAVVDGASIPRVFWSLIGGPFEGRYRNASVVHDVECVEMRQSWSDVHRMFYEACRCGGVDEQQAKIMYYAVYHFGPRWQPAVDEGSYVQEAATATRMVRSDPLPPTPDDIEHVLDFIAEDNPDAAQIERLAPRELRRRPRRPKDRPKHADEREANRGRGSHSPFGGRSESPAIRNAAHRQQGRTAPWEQRAIDIVRGHLERQAGEAVAAEYEVERSQNGLRVHVQFLQLDEEGQAFTYPGGSCTVRLSPEGKVIEVVSGRG